VDLPEIDVAALVHRGSMDRADGVWQEIAGWLDNHAYRTTDHARELYLECPGGGEAQVTEFQQSVITQGRQGQADEH
jgi:effector-binding domain-containing protein